MIRFRRQLLTVTLLLIAAGCQTAGSEPVDMSFAQTPAAVQAAYSQNHGNLVIQQVTRTTNGNQDYYTFKYTGADGKDHTVVMNEAGDEIDSH